MSVPGPARAARKVVRIDEALCDGCGLCVPACAEGALRIVDGKARLVADSLCDGLGACLGDCPRGAILIEERDADAFDEAAVARHHGAAETGGCPGAALQALRAVPGQAPSARAPRGAAGGADPRDTPPSLLGHWPIQLMLVPPAAPFLRGADLVVCADCVPFVVPDFHARYLDGRAVLVGCPKLDDLGHYAEKLVEIVAAARPTRLTVLRMEVPCCGGIAQATLRAAAQAAPGLEVQVHTWGVRGGVRVERP